MPRPNPYETTPRLIDELAELIRERFRCESRKNAILEFGRTGVVLGFAMLFAALMAFFEAGGWRAALARAIVAAGFFCMGLLISYVLYRPVRMRLNEIEAILPQAQPVDDDEPDEESAGDAS